MQTWKKAIRIVYARRLQSLASTLTRLGESCWNWTMNAGAGVRRYRQTIVDRAVRAAQDEVHARIQDKKNRIQEIALEIAKLQEELREASQDLKAREQYYVGDLVQARIAVEDAARGGL